MTISRKLYNALSYIPAAWLAVLILAFPNDAMIMLTAVLIITVDLYELSVLCPSCRWKIKKRNVFGVCSSAFFWMWFGFPKKCPRCGVSVEQINLTSPFRKKRKRS